MNCTSATSLNTLSVVSSSVVELILLGCGMQLQLPQVGNDSWQLQKEHFFKMAYSVMMFQNPICHLKSISIAMGFINALVGR